MRMTARRNLMTERPEAPEVFDALSEVLRTVRLGGAFYFTVEARAPWAAEAPPGHELAQRLAPGSDHVIEYHVITEGSCWAALTGEPPVRLEAGDVVVFPHGDPHVMSSAPGLRGKTPFDGAPMPIHLEIGEKSGERTRVLCGFLGCDAAPFNPLLETLPRRLVVRQAGAHGPLERLTGLVIAEAGARQSGSNCVLARLSELLFIEVVRRHLRSMPGEQIGWLSGLRDPIVGRALGRLHAQPARGWTLESLAREAAASRSILAERFTHLVGIPPMQYLAQWRMQLAANLLMSTSAGLAEIADKVGYGSETALSRAFKRLTGVAPAVWRDRRGAKLPGPRRRSLEIRSGPRD